MECTPEEIAEKRRVALERLKAKKEAMAKAKELSSNTTGKASTASVVSTTIPTYSYQNARNVSHPYANKMSPKNAVNNKQEFKVISCSCYMISESRFEVNPSGFSNKLIDVFRTIPSKGYGK